MSFFRFFRKKKDPSLNYLNKAIIGLGIGLVKARDVILNPDFGPQGAIDVLGVWIGQEIAKEMFAQKAVQPGVSEKEFLEKMLEKINLAEELTLDFHGNEADVTIQECLICPKRVGGYDLEGETACPVGGILVGALSFLKGESPKLPKISLKPGELCNLKLNIKTP